MPQSQTLTAQRDRYRTQFRERLDFLLEHFRTKAEIARKTGLRDGHLSGTFNRKGLPRADFLAKLTAGLRCNPRWLLLGEGEPFGGDAEPVKCPVMATAAAGGIVRYSGSEPSGAIDLRFVFLPVA